ncbi:AP-3 complex subunit delta isoform X2 [Condylostylus longicornis]|uniref:AP-3 complex subunit delta isoform X2 n=1 Tax=Condylostylus longicornis TaxID=2530218 RepID=UPI00244DF666|nr:AP-3 complex subunit delta isoform X2 [Condylostylus longicornis]
MALKKNFQRMFEKNLTDLVRGIRNNKENEARYISECIEEIKQELRQDNISVKCNAVAKLTYIQMLGYDISWAGFNIIEVMSSPKFTCKRVGYLAAAQCFHADSELLMLTTNMIRKDLNSTNQYDAGVALSGLSCFISADLSRDLANDIMTLMSSTKPYLRMKAVLMMYKVFLRYPEALRPAFPKLKEKLEDSDPGVQSAAVNVICELARKNPKNYLSLAPIFFKLMTTSTNNWMLIKIIKLFGSLTEIEPALGRKLTHPLIEIISSTTAMSLLYECINTVIAVLISISSGMPNNCASIQLCVQKLRILIEDSDQNLKYLGLLAMSKILKTHPKSVQAHKDLILACLDDKDESIRLRALDLLYGMVSKKNLMEIVKRLLGHLERAEGSIYRDELLYKIIEICSQGSYQYVTNFEWYLTVLVELIQLESNSKHGKVIADQLLDVAIRVQAVRTFAVVEMTTLLDNFNFSSPISSMYEVLYAAAFIVGEFASEIEEPERALGILLRNKYVPGHIRAVFIQNTLKLFTRLITTCLECQDVNGIIRLCEQVYTKLQNFVKSDDIEVQERANSGSILIKMIQDALNGSLSSKNNFPSVDVPMTKDILGDLDPLSRTISNPSDVKSNNFSEKPESSKIPESAIELIQEMGMLFDGDLNPVAPKAQRKVPIPDGLDLDAWIHPPSEDEDDGSTSSQSELSDLFVPTTADRNGNDDYDQSSYRRRKNNEEYSKEEIEKRKQVRLLEQMNNPNYLKSDNSKNKNKNIIITEEGTEEVPVAELALEIPLEIHSTKRSDKYVMESNLSKSKKKIKKSKKGRKSKNKVNYSTSETEEEEPKLVHLVNTSVEIPEGAEISDNDENDKKIDPNDPHRALDINLDDILLKNDNEFKDLKKKNSRHSNYHRKENNINFLKINSTDAINENEIIEKKSSDDRQHHHRLKKGKKKDKHSNSFINDEEERSEKNNKDEKKRSKKKSSKHEKDTKSNTVDIPESNLLLEFPMSTNENILKENNHHKKDHKEHHHHKKEKKHSSKRKDTTPKAGYEEACGISTPSKEVFNFN